MPATLRAATAPQIDVQPLTSCVGAEIGNVDLAADLPEHVFAGIRQALYRWGVVFFRDQYLDAAQYLAFARRMGEIEERATLNHVEGHPQIGLLVKEADHKTSIGDMWHVDHTYMTDPISMTMLMARQVPPYGGDTLFAHAGKAFAALPEEIKEMLRKLKTLHLRSHLIKDSRYKAQYLKERPPQDAGEIKQAAAIHPAVKLHPESGEEILYVNPGYTVQFDGWPRELSVGILEGIFDHVLQPEFQCRFRWREGSIALWDNRAVWHRALNDYHGHRREMYRVMIA